MLRTFPLFLLVVILAQGSRCLLRDVDVYSGLCEASLELRIAPVLVGQVFADANIAAVDVWNHRGEGPTVSLP